MGIIAFYHISLINHWEALFTETLQIMVESGLYEAIESINLGVIHTKVPPFWKEHSKWSYDENAYERLLEIIKDYKKINILYVHTEKNSDEFQRDERCTLNIIHDKCIQWENVPDSEEKIRKKILYFHMKGITHDSTSVVITGWRDTMNYFLLQNWRIAVQKLDEYDTVGCLKVDTELHKFTSYDETVDLQYVLHYTGGYWWANSQYLTKVNYWNRNGTDRVSFEEILCTGSPKERHFSFFDTPGMLPEQNQVILPNKKLWECISKAKDFL